jgi:hypothetical protein
VGRGRPTEKCRDESGKYQVRGRTERGTVSYDHRKKRMSQEKESNLFPYLFLYWEKESNLRP